MALSIYNSNWAPLQHLNDPEMTNNNFQQPQAQPEPAMELPDFQENFLYPEYPYSIDPLFESNHDLILPYLAQPPDNSIPQEFDSELYQYQYSYPKRQKCYEDDYFYHSEDLTPCLFDGFVPNLPLLPEFSHVPLPEFLTPSPAFDYGCGEATSGRRASGGGGGGGSLSAQSIAARQRRRKITEKTRELGKLIPGGHKMNTAEMFHAASKYIKFLQAQVGILEFMGSTKENEEEVMHTPELQTLAISPRIQEKLYSSEKCLVSKQLVESLANDPELHSNALVSNQLLQLNRTTSG